MSDNASQGPGEQLAVLEAELAQSEKKVEKKKKHITTLKKFLGETDAAKKKYADAFDQIKKKVAEAVEYYKIQLPHIADCNPASFKSSVDAYDGRMARTPT